MKLKINPGYFYILNVKEGTPAAQCHSLRAALAVGQNISTRQAGLFKVVEVYRVNSEMKAREHKTFSRGKVILTATSNKVG